MKTAALLAVTLLTGCSLAPSDKVIRELAKSDRSWCVSAVTIYGRGAAGGSGVHGGTMTCNLDGLSVTSEAAKVGVPMNVVPQITIGAPTLQAPPPPVVAPQPRPRPVPGPRGESPRRDTLSWLDGPGRLGAILAGMRD